MLKDSFIHYLLLVNRYINPFGKKSENSMSDHKTVHTSMVLFNRKLSYLLCTSALLGIQ